MEREMLINVVAGQECRIAIVEDGKLEELYTERVSSASHVGNIYKGRITNVEPSIQAAFVDFGLAKNGFLHISDVHPQYFPAGRKDASEDVGRKRPHRRRPPIQECFRRGQSIVVQMTKEGIGTKGPTMTTYLSIPGRLLVMMPGMSRMGVSRKVEDPELRNKTRQVLSQLKLPSDIGFIVRTAGVARSKRDLQRDLNYLTRLWKAVKLRIENSKAPAEIYQESDLVTRTIRDVYNANIQRIICDDELVTRKAKEFLDVAMPRTKHHVELYVGKEGLFHDYGLESEIERIYSRRVELPSGGSIVIDQTEALVAIDVNSGRFREHSDAETTALKINQEAAREIARQLRLRDMGGVIVIDFIDMQEAKSRQAVEKALRDAMKTDRAKTKILRISALGIVEMTRQRIRPSLKDSIYRRCAECDGTGLIKSEESQALLVMRCLQRATANEEVAHVEVGVTASVAEHLNNYHRKEISRLEARTGKTILVRAEAGLSGDDVSIRCTNARGSELAWQRQSPAESGKPHAQTVDIETLDKLDKNTRPIEDSRAEDEQQGARAPEAQQPPEKPDAPEAKVKKSRRRGRRGGRKRKKTPEAEANSQTKPSDEPPNGADADGDSDERQGSENDAASRRKEAPAPKKSRRAGRRKKPAGPNPQGGADEGAPAPVPQGHLRS